MMLLNVAQKLEGVLVLEFYL